jgi:outer membrane protein
MKGFIKALAVAALFVTGAQAADLSAPAAGGYKDAPYVADTWWNAGDIFVRVRAEALIPQVSTGNWNPAIPGANLAVDTVFLPELDLSYFLTKNIAVELVCCFDRVDIHSAGSVAALGKAGSTWLFPPTLLAQYHFDGFGAFKPYVGAGVNYTVFFDEQPSGKFTHLGLDNAVGGAVQVGLDYHLDGNWFANVDFKKLWLGTDWNVNVTGVGHVSGHVDIDPIIVGAGIGYRFGAPYIPLK